MAEINAKILLWGIEGSGKSTSLKTIHAKLRPDLRGDLLVEPTRLDPTIQYESLSITLGEVGGVGTQLEIVSVPGAADQTMTRKQLLDEVDGIIIVLDASPERIDANYAAIDELRASLAAYGHRLDAFPIVLQYNKRDIADPFAIEELHRRIGLDQAAVFETIATTGHGILATLTTISKHVVRTRRNSSPATASEVPTAATAATASEIEDSAASSHEILEAAILAEGDELGEDGGDGFAELLELEPMEGEQPNWDAVSGEPSQAAKPEGGLGERLRIVSAGRADVEANGNLRLPLVLGDDAGQTRTVVLSLRLDTLLSDGDD
jgi:signal recognition particle receptor subunit beta